MRMRGQMKYKQSMWEGSPVVSWEKKKIGNTSLNDSGWNL